MAQQSHMRGISMEERNLRSRTRRPGDEKVETEYDSSRVDTADVVVTKLGTRRNAKLSRFHRPRVRNPKTRARQPEDAGHGVLVHGPRRQACRRSHRCFSTSPWEIYPAAEGPKSEAGHELPRQPRCPGRHVETDGPNGRDGGPLLGSESFELPWFWPPGACSAHRDARRPVSEWAKGATARAGKIPGDRGHAWGRRGC